MHPHSPHHQRHQPGIVAPGPFQSRSVLPVSKDMGTWRTLTIDDAEIVLDLLQECETYDSAPFRSTLDEIAELFVSRVLNVAIGAFGDDGKLIGYGIVRVLGDGAIVDARCSGSVRPQWRDRGIGSAIVEWQIEAARSLLAEVDTSGGAQISHFCDESAVEEAELLVRMGFSVRSWFTQMRRDLSIEIPTPEMAPHLRVEPWNPEWSTMIREASEAPEALTIDGRRLTEEEWERMHENLVPEWSAVVFDRSTERSRIAGYVMAARWDDEWEALGWSEGYMNALAIFSPWRKQKVGQRLLTRAMHRMREAGMEFAGIDIGSEDVEGLDDLCATMGFEPTHRTTLYAIDV